MGEGSPREFSLGGKDQYFEAAKDSEKLSKIVVVLKNEFSSTGLDLSSFDLDDLAKAAIPKVNELLYDTLAYIVKTDSAAEHFLLGTDSVSDRDGRRALLALIKGCVPPGSSPTPSVGFDKENRRALPLCHRCGREGEGKKYHGYKECPYGGKNAAGTAAYCMPAGGEGADEAMRTLALCQIFQVAADDGSDAFAAAVAEYGAPAVLAGGKSDDIDVSAYGFTVDGSSSGVMPSELEALTGQVRAMEERVGVHLSQVSLVENEDVIEHRAPVDAPCSANAVTSDVPRQVVPPAGDASAGGAILATGGYMAHVHPATEEFPGAGW
ncbi:hypothetical protein CYMTET_20355 [Cymbomonas tetramitiformis]|uniref:Uncharacterized protein n=1 Tax=Cymbomonas tetramitiformis TaxID=36881 RepID=A0AAE0G481_9CHLO|nr:hypothetical protein CYMTET_20355 [Cymbomonas tetramitiformis]